MPALIAAGVAELALDPVAQQVTGGQNASVAPSATRTTRSGAPPEPEYRAGDQRHHRGAGKRQRRDDDVDDKKYRRGP